MAISLQQANKMRVRLVYRNYKPLHDMYASLKLEPPPGVTYITSPPKTILRKIYPLYLRFGDTWLARRIIARAQKMLFDKPGSPDVDLLHYMQMLPGEIPERPFVLDFEHVVSLANFVAIDETMMRKIRDYLESPFCKKIIPLSHAARRTLEGLLGNNEEIARKIEVIYPALPDYHALSGKQSGSLSSDTFNLLFVGNSPYKKGLHELLAAFQILAGKYSNIHLSVISDASKLLKNKYDLPNIAFFPPRFSHDEIINKFYLPSNLFVMPTHDDTFGMAQLYALACGTPVVTTKQFANPELITHGYNGLFVKSNRLHLEDVPLPNRSSTNRYHLRQDEETILVKDLVEKISSLYENRELLKQLERNTHKDFATNGKFSINTRNKKLTQVYAAC